MHYPHRLHLSHGWCLTIFEDGFEDLNTSVNPLLINLSVLFFEDGIFIHEVGPIVDTTTQLLFTECFLLHGCSKNKEFNDRINL
jgi:hypothetical protein